MGWKEAVDDYTNAYLACVKAASEAEKQAKIAKAVAEVYKKEIKDA